MSNTPQPEAPLSQAALWSLILAFVPICGLAQIAAVVLAIVALVKIRDAHGALRGEGLAIGGLVVSGLAVFMIPVVAAVVLPTLLGAKKQELQIKLAKVEMLRLRQALEVYRSDTNRYPTAEEGLAVLAQPTKFSGPILDQGPGALTDPFGHPYRYEPTPLSSYRLSSDGPDGREGTPDDVRVDPGP